ncbi:acyl carrier protein [Nocardiopsis quinghaiensis]|uniref:acyl carrier protein n=1 Tax=Nocardiopsis quinghaiensis TaxID=464995 RepID=UPI001CC268C2|nr:acyl carrier protein [Nocardiopsis quinghaiensis]
MNEALERNEVTERLMAFVRERFLDGDPHGELEETSPLVEWGVLNSLNSAILLNFIHREFAGAVPLEHISAANFRDVRSISAMLCAQR